MNTIWVVFANYTYMQKHTIPKNITKTKSWQNRSTYFFHAQIIASEINIKNNRLRHHQAVNTLCLFFAYAFFFAFNNGIMPPVYYTS